MSMKSKLRQLVNKQLATFQALRKCGFDSDDIYLRIDGRKVFTELRPSLHPNLTFRIDYPGAPDVDAQEYIRMWQAAAEWWNREATLEQRNEIYFRWYTADHLGALALAIFAKGISVPNHPNLQHAHGDLH